MLYRLALTAIICFALAGTAIAQNGLPSSKATAAVNTLVRCNMTAAQSGDTAAVPSSCVELFSGAAVPVSGSWIEIMSKPVKMSNSQSLFVSPSLVSGLYTRTRTKTQDGSTSTAEAMGAVYLRAELDPVEPGLDNIVAAPLNLCTSNIWGCAQRSGQWGVVLDSRIQTLTQDITACTALVGGISGTCDFTSTIDFILKTASANTFNFIFANVPQGTYTLRLYASVGSGASIVAGSGTAVGAAAFGLGSMTAEVVRLVHDFQF